ncbi:hypothetical protein VE01_07028 [Pseudogymnoascus verrucosus]|uniref:Protein kinase domain-containing protein n=1 Tax=Pseudogymnoascus verrucosus TaxID=342668 RepID=A0A1B8GE84_9PEZI|nr:uncharacterized protein VE01_07028 [Pseudogymnoascus verrucosus]OBT94123.1 hypothetical protein VE01_07028 [Pseudogymnoascus verrucosus]
MIAAMQRIAATIIPDLIPKTYQIGKAVNAQGRMFHFSVVELVEGDLLEDVWQLMSAGEQNSVVADLVEALEKLHSVRLCDNMAQDVLRKMLREDGEELRPFFGNAWRLWWTSYRSFKQRAWIAILYHGKEKAKEVIILYYGPRELFTRCQDPV